MVCSSVSIASISHIVRVSLLNTTNNPSLCWILAYRVCGGGSSPRHKPTRNVCLTLKTLATPTYRVLHRLAILTDLRFRFMALDPVLFPGIPKGIKVHSGFAVEHKKTANQILTEVERLMHEYSLTHVILVRLYYRNSLPSGYRTYLFRHYTHRSVTHSAEGSRNLTRCS